MLERDIERRFVSKVQDLGIPCIKLNIKGNRGWPDRLCLLPGGRAIFIEFKRPGEELTPLQEHIHEQLLKDGFTVFICYAWRDAVAAITSLLGTAQLPEDGHQVVTGARFGGASS